MSILIVCQRVRLKMAGRFDSTDLNLLNRKIMLSVKYSINKKCIFDAENAGTVGANRLQYETRRRLVPPNFLKLKNFDTKKKYVYKTRKH